MRALDIGCPKCPAVPGDFCSGAGTFVGRFHVARVSAAARATYEANFKVRAAMKGVLL